ncbi:MULTISPECIES: DDE-type integrase/transposase/recombinase [unclassified Mesorhizobium]|uniref:DDE-type integrase/transposase/recombinase n=1 Tax=unclassified Mesorhizobium TaxID=325217 RepID=UPI00333E1134
MLLERGIVASYETIRRWGKKFGLDYARRLRRKQPSRNDIWHLDEVAITIAGKKHWLWRAVNQDGYVLDEIVQTRRNTKAAKRLLTAVEEAGPGAEADDHRQARLLWSSAASSHAGRRAPVAQGLNNRAENSHVPRRKRERMMQGFRSPGSLQRFVSTFLCSPQSLRPAPFKMLRLSDPSSPPECQRNGKLLPA